MAAMTARVDLIHDAKASLGEGPIWNEREGKLYWLDINGKCIHVFEPKSGKRTKYRLDQYPGALAFKESGGFLLAAHHGFYDLELGGNESLRMSKIADPEARLPENRFNDGKCDPAGRFLAGTIAFDEEKGAASLYVLNQDKKVEKIFTDLTISNGMAWSPDETLFYFIDTSTMKVKAYSYNKETGELGEGQTVIDFTDKQGAPDGMTIDEEGMLWIALYGGWGVVRVDPSNGEVLDTIEVPASNVTCCIFGGEKLDELYITTARKELSEQDLKKQPLAGGLFRCKPGVAGKPSYRFKG